MNSDVLRKPKNAKPIYIYLAVSVALIVIFIILIRLMVINDKNFLENRKLVGESLYLEIDSEPVKFRVFNEGEYSFFYLVSNKDDYFIVKLSDRQYETIKSEYEKRKNNFKFKLEGTGYAIFSNLRDSSIKLYNELGTKTAITVEDFEEYFGITYLDATNTTRGLIRAVLFGIGALILIMDVFVIAVYIYGMKTYNKMILEYGEEELIKELDGKDTVALPKAGIYLTNKYIISNLMGFKIVDYKDVFWVYILKEKSQGAVLNRSLNAYKREDGGYTIDSVQKIRCSLIVNSRYGKTYTLAMSYDYEELDKLISKIVKKNKNVLVGDTSENKNKYNKMLAR